ncbi:hypothetical protein [Sphingobacterium multivorum]|uniref:hypothetical protein n=1 Tax=Sphingobacterium multivorum TaxID=28454 RepID=UPI0028AEC7A2|nr:hypothetical protein [Sphingobacterium multivorum]
MNKYEQYEKEGREKLISVFPETQWIFSYNTLSTFDAYAEHKGKKIIAEIKTRNFSSYAYDTCYIELDKAISNLTYNDVDSVLYVVHYTNDVTCTWNLSNIDLSDLTASTRLMNQTTAQDTGKIHKEVYELKVNDADIRSTSTGKKIKKQ